VKNENPSGEFSNRLSKAYVTAFLLLAIGIGAIGYFHLEDHSMKSRISAEEELSTIGKLKAKEIVTWYSDQLDHANYLYNSPSIIKAMMHLKENPSELESIGVIKERMASIHRNFHCNRVLLFDSSLRLVYSFPEDKTWTGPTSKKFIADTLREGKIMVSDLHLSKMVPGTVDMDIFVPIVSEKTVSDQTRKSVGVLMLEINPHEFLFPLIQSWPTASKSAETLLVRKEGDEVVFLNELRHRKDTALKLRFPIAEKSNLPAQMAVTGKKGIIEGLDYRGVDVIADIGPVPGTPWFLVSKVDEDEIYSPLKKEAGITVVLIMILIFSTALGVGFLWKQRDAELLRKSRDELERRVIERTVALERSLKEISDLYNNAPCGYHSLDKDGKFVMVNDTELKWLGYAKEEMIGKKIFDIFTPKSQKIFQVEFPQFKEKGYVKDLDLELIRKDGSMFPIILNATALKDTEGNYMMSRSTTVDITERKRIGKELEKLNRSLKLRTEELEAVNRELEAFSYSVSHDLKAPLRSVDGFSRILEEDYAGKFDDEGRRLLKVIRDSAKDMGQLISDLLDFSRMSRKDLHKTNINMNDLVRESYSKLENELKGRVVSLDLRELPEAFGDYAMIHEVFANLIANAFKFTRHAKVALVKVEGRTEGDEVIFTVRDNGVGFDMEYKDKLFCVFQRLHSAAEFEGTGIGLALVQRIIQRHGGRVWAEGKIGEGAEFSFSLPVVVNKQGM